MTRVCVITGGSRGIGLATAVRFARGGAQLCISGRGARDLEAAAAQLRALGAECEAAALDVGRPDEARRLIARALERFGRIDVLVNNAGRAPLAKIEQFEASEFDATAAVNMAAVFHTSQAVWPVMRRQGGGVIVNVSSVASVDPFPGFAVYGASKAWVNVFSQALAVEGKPHNIRVYSVAPGAVETGMLRGAFPDFPADQTLAPDDVAAVIESVCGDPLRPCTGQTIFVRK